MERSRRPFPIRIVLSPVAVVAAAAAFGCGGDSSPAAPGIDDPNSPTGDPTGDPTSDLECEQAAYPCVWTEVPEERVTRTTAVLDTVSGMVHGGASMADAKTWLEGLADLAELHSDEDALRFRLDGGRPVWVFREVAGSGASATAGIPRGAVAPGAEPTPSPARAPVGEDPDRKKALVMSPYLWQFGESDEGAAVRSLLAQTRGYDDRSVAYVTSAAFNDGGVTVDHFKGMDIFDVVHITSHGRTSCLGDDCRAVIVVRDDPRPLDIVARDYSDYGVTFSRTDTVTQVALEAEFFRKQYPDGLTNALIYFSACETVSGTGSDLARALAGSSSVYLGWDSPVQSGPARTAALELYRRLADEGVTVRTALEEIGSLRNNTYFDEDTDRTIIALLFRYGPFPPVDRRIRETVWIEHPDNDEPLADGDGIAPLGTLGDGVPDTLPYRIRVDGVEGSPLDYGLNIEMDGHRIDHPTLVEGQPLDGLTWILEGKALLNRDLKEGDRVPITAYVELPDQGRTEQSLEVEIIAPPPSTWVGTATHVLDSPLFGATIVETEASNLVFERVEDPSWPPGAQRWEVVSGQLSWSTQGEVIQFFGPACQYGAGPFVYDVVPGSAYIEIDPNVPSGPARYRLFASFEGPTLTISTSCAGVDYTTRVQSAWMAVFPDEDRRVSQDGSVIQGSKENSLNKWTWSLRRQVETQP